MAENTARRWHRSRAARATVARVCTSEKHWAVSFGSSHASASDKKGETLVVALSKFYFRKLNLSRESNKLRQNFLFSFDWLLHFISMLINLIFSARQRRQCCCHRNSRRVDVRTIRQTSGGTSNCDTQTRTSTIGITSEFISFVFKSDKSSLGWKGKEEESWRELFGPSQSRMWFKSIPSCFLIQSCFGSCTLSSDFPLFVWGWEEHQVWKIFYFEPPCISLQKFLMLLIIIGTSFFVFFWFLWAEANCSCLCHIHRLTRALLLKNFSWSFPFFSSQPPDRYCIEFEVIKATKACRKDPVYKQLEVGERVVVKCDLEAFLPNDDKDDDSANEVYSHKDNKNLENETIEDFKSVKTTSKSKSKYRCRGEGSTGRNTRFSAMAIPSCHGKWMRLTVGQPKKCSYQDSQFIFV